MIILSAGMPRAGSGWYYNLTNELMLANGAQDARKIRQKYHLETILSAINCNIGALTARRLFSVLVPSLLGNTFVIKAHAGPTGIARLLIRLKWLRVAYIYRDPRDALLSAYENGERARQRGQLNAFSYLVDFEAALKFMQDYVHISEAWLDVPAVLHSRYEDLVQDYDQESAELARFLEVDAEQAATRQVIGKFQPQAQPADQKGLHFSKGKIGRFHGQLSLEQQERLRLVFGAYLERLNYPV
jgi:Sulfotransferase domain